MVKAQFELDFRASQPKKTRRKQPRGKNATANNAAYRQRLRARELIVSPTEKICCTCKLRKPGNEFANNKSEKDGLSRVCRACKSVQHNTRRDILAKDYKAADYKTCSSCKQAKPGSEFYKQTSSKSGLTARCKTCSDAHSGRYYAENREDIILMTRLYARHNPDITKSNAVAKRNRERVQKFGTEGSFSPREWRELVAYYGRCCAYCARPESEVGVLTCDHVVPLSKGGTGYLENVAPACLSCNATKGDKSLLEFIEYRSRIERMEMERYADRSRARAVQRRTRR